MATIRKRGKRYQVQVRRAGIPPVSKSFSTRTDAMEWARHMECRADRGELPANLRDLRRITVSEVLEQYRDKVVSRKRAAPVEQYIVNALLRQPFARKTLAEAEPRIFAAYRDARLKVVRPITICRELNLLQHAFDIARREWDVPLHGNPMKQVRKPPAGQGRERRLAPGEEALVLSSAASSRNPYLRPLIQFALETGMRRGELLALTWEQIDFNLHTAHIPISKNGKARTIPLSYKAEAILKDLPSRGGQIVFPLSAEAVKKGWQRLTERAGISNLHFHDLRHEAISRLFELGLSLPEVALVSGHRDPRMLFRYTHLSACRIAEKLREIGQPG